MSTPCTRHGLSHCKENVSLIPYPHALRSLQSVTKPNVRVVQTGVSAFCTDGCIDDLGERYEVDIIICATGYDTSFIPRFPILGLEGVSLQDTWSPTPSSYFGIGTSSSPNFLMFLGPYSPIANGPTMAAIGKLTI